MNIQDYIASGILEQYLMGLLTDTERQEVERNLAQYPELREELDRLEHTLESYLSLHRRPAPPGLDAEVLKRINDDVPTPPPAAAGKSSPWPWLLGLLALAALLACWWLYQQRASQQDTIDRLTTELAELQAACDQTRQDSAVLEQQLAIIRNANTRLVQMRGTPKAPEAIASVYWNTNDQKAYLDVISLPDPPTDKQYQLWAIVDGNPVDMGVFEVVIDSSGLQEVPFIANAQAFAVTLENRGGSTTGPTLEEMVVIGNVS